MREKEASFLPLFARLGLSNHSAAPVDMKVSFDGAPHTRQVDKQKEAFKIKRLELAGEGQEEKL